MRCGISKNFFIRNNKVSLAHYYISSLDKHNKGLGAP